MDELLSGRRVLVVEDEFLVLMLIEDMLGDLGCESVSTAPSVRKALALVEAQPFEVAMLDMNLNGDRPFAIADALAARGVPFMFATGYSGHDLSAGYGDRPLLKKPFHAHELRKIMTGLLSHSAEASPLSVAPR